MTDKTVIIIPARYASTRFEGKPLAMLTGATGARKSLVQRSWETACDVPGVDRIFVATDDQRIADAVYSFGGQVIMTSPTCRNGTERVAEAVQKLPQPADIVVNLQGDAPLTPPWFITALIDEMKGDTTVEMATPVLRCDRLTLNMFREDRRNGAGRVAQPLYSTRIGMRSTFRKRFCPSLTNPMQRLRKPLSTTTLGLMLIARAVWRDISAGRREIWSVWRDLSSCVCLNMA